MATLCILDGCLPRKSRLSFHRPISIDFETVLDRRPKFFHRSRRFKTYCYGYSGQSLRPFLWPKVLIVILLGFFSKMEAQCVFQYTGASLDWIRLLWITIELSLKIKTGPFFMRFLYKMIAD